MNPMEATEPRPLARPAAPPEAAPQAEVQTTNRIDGSRRWWVLAAVMITMFFSSMDQTVVSTAMPTIIGALHGLSLYAWVFTAYMMAAAVTVPIYGKLSDVYGRKPFYIFGLAIFMVGSAISGQAHTMLELVLARAGQGIGAGAMMSMPRATIGDIFNPRERGRWMGVIGAVFGLASIIGPTLGGWITDSFGWQWVFYINLPIAAVAIAMVWRYLPTVRTPHAARPDYVGSGILVVGLMAILLGFTWAGSQYAWGSWQILGLFAFGVATSVLFVLHERRTADPILAPDLFRNEIFTSSLVVGLLMAMGMFGALSFLPLFVQGALGVSAAASGAILTPMMIAFIGGSVVGGQVLTRLGHYKLPAHVAALFMVAGMYLLTRMTAATTLTTVVINVVILGVGIGALMPLLNVAVQNAFPYRIMGTVNATQQFVQSLGGVIAIPVLGTIMISTFNRQLPRHLPTTLGAALAHLSPAARTALGNPETLTTSAAQSALKGDFSHFGAAGLTLYHQFLNAVHLSLADGIHGMFEVGLMLSVGAFLGTFFLREVRLKQDEFFRRADGEDATDDAAPQLEPAP
jgi:EmrB/QacA subfamily drug resistance transporter